MKYFISIALSPEQYRIGIALTEWVTKWSKEYFISIALHSIALAHLHVIFNTNKILMQYCILLVLHYSIALASFFCLGWFVMIKVNIGLILRFGYLYGYKFVFCRKEPECLLKRQHVPLGPQRHLSYHSYRPWLSTPWLR